MNQDKIQTIKAKSFIRRPQNTRIKKKKQRKMNITGSKSKNILGVKRLNNTHD